MRFHVTSAGSSPIICNKNLQRWGCFCCGQRMWSRFRESPEAKAFKCGFSVLTTLYCVQVWSWSFLILTFLQVRERFVLLFSKWALQQLDNFYHLAWVSSLRRTKPQRSGLDFHQSSAEVQHCAPGSALGRHVLGMSQDNSPWACLESHVPPKEQFQKRPGSVSACPWLTHQRTDISPTVTLHLCYFGVGDFLSRIQSCSGIASQICNGLQLP